MTRPPNILLITTDQQHHAAMGSRTPMLRTPAIDSLARDGMSMGRAYCPNPLCSPSRSSIITGEYPSWHGCWTIGTKLDEERMFLPDLLGAAGWATSLIGKAHFQPLASTPEQTSLECQPTLRDLDFWRQFHGPYYGFDHVELARNHADESHVGQHYAIWMEENGFGQWREHFRSWPPRDEPARRGRWDLPQDLHYSTWTGERTMAAIDAALDADQPFFTWSSFHDPHPPYLVPEPYASMYDPSDVPVWDGAGEDDGSLPLWVRMVRTAHPDFAPWRETGHHLHGCHSQLVPPDQLRRDIATYFGMMTFVDDQVGRILRHLEDRGVADDTLVLFTSDHGHFHGQHGLTAKGPFHYEDLLKVPFLARWTGRIPAGRRSDALLSLVDLAPTILAAAGLAVPGQMQGVDQLDVLTGAAASLRDWVMVENRHETTSIDLRTYVTARYKLTIYRGQSWGELFDLQEDPGELRNLWSDPGVAGLRNRLLHEAWQAELERQPTRYARIAGA